MKFKILIISGLLAGGLSGCYVVPMESDSRVVQTPVGQNSAITHDTVLNARLYPTNPAAQSVGTGHATVTITQNGHGVFHAAIGSERFTGDATRNLQSRSGKANGAGSAGRYISCDYTMNSDSIGTGQCRLSTGATFSMHISR